MREHCGVYLVVEHNGDVFPCDFYVEESLNLGNIKENNLVELFNSQEQFCFGQKKAELPETCLTCQWLKYCRGGCPKERLAGNLNYFCKGLKEFYQHADRRFQLLATRWKHQQKMDEQQQKKEDKPGRNSPCSCGSGKKFKKCCGK